MKRVIFFLLLAVNLFAINCGDFTGEFKTYNGHYYAITGNKMSFQNAKNFAQANNGYLAVPNTLAENNFIKGIVGTNNEAWIGIYDPNYTQSLCFTNNCYSTSRSRFKTVQGTSLAFQNWDSTDIENQFMEHDDTVDSMDKPIISLLGEHWALLSGNTGLWRDWGTHFFTGENPAIQKAMIEFDTKPTCYEAPSTVTGEITGRVCNSQVWDTVLGVSDGTTAQCLTDINNVEYCPQSLAQCGSSWDYDNGYSVSGVGTFTETYKPNITLDTMQPNIISVGNGNSYAPISQHASLSLSNGKISLFTGGTYSSYYDIAQGYSKFYNPNAPNMNPCEGLEIDNGKIRAIGKDGCYPNGSYWVNSGAETFGNWVELKKGGTSLAVMDIWGNKWGFEINEYRQIRFLMFTSSFIYGNWVDIDLKFSCNPNYTYDLSLQMCAQTTYYCYKGGELNNNKDCVLNQNYTYYNYLCNNGYSPVNSGGSCNPTSTNQLIDTNGDNIGDSCNSSTPPLNNCKKEKFTCLANASRPCALVDNKMQCSPFPCVGSNDFENLGTVEGQNDKNNSGWNNEGSCAGQLYIFNGEDKRCRLKDKFFGLTGGGCCDKDKVFMGLIACKDNEKILAKKRNNDLCHYVGQYCSKKLKFLGCIQTSESYCCFSSKLGRIIHEQGRPQLGISWGSGDSPNCRGFTPDEFQKLDFSKLDFTEFAKDIQTKTTNFNNIGGFVQNKVQNFFQQ